MSSSAGKPVGLVRVILSGTSLLAQRCVEGGTRQPREGRVSPSASRCFAPKPAAGEAVANGTLLASAWRAAALGWVHCPDQLGTALFTCSVVHLTWGVALATGINLNLEMNLGFCQTS
jgi:hypothetical protein